MKCIRRNCDADAEKLSNFCVEHRLKSYSQLEPRITDREATLVDALLAVVPSHRNPASRCWCGHGAATHSEGCLKARAALKAVGQ